MRTFNIKFVDFWDGFDPRDNAIVSQFERYGKVFFVDREPDYLIYSSMGSAHLGFDNPQCVKIFFTAENVAPDFSACDYALASDRIQFGDRYHRLPNYAFTEGFKDLADRPTLTPRDLIDGRKFCNYIYSNPAPNPIRHRFFTELCDYKKVDAPGVDHNNMQSLDDRWPELDRVQKKERFLKQYKFCIAFENSTYPGYTTEKLVQALVARTVPIYWGAPDVERDFNPASFINAAHFANLQDLVAEVARIDSDDDAYQNMLNAVPCDSELIEDMTTRTDSFWETLLTQQHQIARRRPRYGYSRFVESRNAKLENASPLYLGARRAKRQLRRLYAQ